MRRLRTPGFTLVEVLVSITVIAVIAAMVVPRMSDDSAIRLRAASAILSSDLEYAQVRGISHPGEPVVVRFDPARSRYWLAMATTPDTPITREDNGEPYLVIFGEGRAGSAGGVTFSLIDVVDDTLAFDAQGGLDDFTTEPIIALSIGASSLHLVISPMTGSITEEVPEEGEKDEESLLIK